MASSGAAPPPTRSLQTRFWCARSWRGYCAVLHIKPCWCMRQQDDVPGHCTLLSPRHECTHHTCTCSVLHWGAPCRRQLTSRGRLEVESGGVWYSGLCQTAEPEDSGAIARVVCRQLGFEGGVGTSFSRSSGSAHPMIGSLQCSGTEAKLADCSFTATSHESCFGWGPESDSEAYMEGVVCDGALMAAIMLAQLRLCARCLVHAQEGAHLCCLY